ncbi:efflux RND transporter periplasmic adaptor subunit [Chitinophaga qingshengii]|uniref:Efflux RND transporter periplasmic adaptor subunit n=1 Tax=Chitinophaga qingshengii TaxID=1569794 RepID=A0ABR7TWS0_9BACT|nr:efflux RND transporter periplasmic adaptor subunit [Chitinophaga qingshengii]MBC9934924.1 efflux RND transporter periplasmic adaptor subunit [Chitinophaga qingshengii]
MRFSYTTIGLVLLIMGAGCQSNEKNAEVSRRAAPDSVAVFLLHKDTVNKRMTFPAELIPLERAEIFAKVSGYVGSLKVDIGDKVSKGQLLAVLEAPEALANYSQANADVQTARSRYLGSLDAYKRIVNAARVEGTIAAGELEKANSQMMADSAALNAARSKTSAFAQLKDYLTIRAPFNGIVTQRNVDPGTLVSAGNPKPLLVLENISTLRLRVPVPEAYTAATAESPAIDFTVDAQPDVVYQATLSRKAGALNLSNRTETWEFLFANPQQQLKSGMYANAVLKLGRKAPTFLVPSSAVVTNLEKRFVIRLRNGQTEWVDVRNGINLGDKIEIFGNLTAGDTLLTRASDEIKPGTTLVPKLAKQ